jgi:DNA-binding transcriptional ArsR family regulator
VLKDAGLVTDRREGNRSWNRLDPAGVGHLHRYLDDLWGRALEGFKAAIEQPEEGP